MLEEKCVENKYDENGDYINEKSETIFGFNKTNYEYNEDKNICVSSLINNDISTNKNYQENSILKKYSFDDWGRQNKISIYGNDELLLENRITTSDYSMIVDDHNAYYRSENDPSTNVSKYFIGNLLIQESKVIENSIDDSMAIKNFYYTENARITNSQMLDRNSRLTSLVNDDNEYTFVYNESEYGAINRRNVKSIKDKKYGWESTYSYDYYSDLTTINVKNANDNFSYEIKKINSSETLYRFNNELRKTSIKYDEKVICSPRIIETKNSMHNNVWNDYSGFMDTYYTYDELGRIKKIHNHDRGVTYEIIYHKKNNQTCGLIDNYIVYSQKNSIDKDYYLYEKENTYDLKNGRLLKEDEYYYDNRGGLENRIIKEYWYEYDAIGRLTSYFVDTTKGEGTSLQTVWHDFEYEKNDRNLGKLKAIYVKSDDNTKIGRVDDIIEYNYDTLGRLVNVKSNFSKNRTYEYDSYGNITKINSKLNIEHIRGNILSKFSYDNRTCEYKYDHNSVRYEKVLNDGEMVIKSFLDGDKLLGENIYAKDGSVQSKRRYFYDATGICGIQVDSCYYRYIKDDQGNVVRIVDENGNVKANYEYDYFGNVEIYDFNHNKIVSTTEIGVINPFRWKSYYYDVETGFYYIDGRYYDPYSGIFIDAQEITAVFKNFSNIFGIDRYGMGVLNNLTYNQNRHSIFTTLKMSSDLIYDDEVDKSWFEKYFAQVIQGAFIVVKGIASILVGNFAGAIMSIVELGATIISALPKFRHLANSITQGLIASESIINGIRSVLCGHYVIGAITIACGVSSSLFAVSEGMEYATGQNFIKDAVGNGLYTGLYIANTIVTLLMNSVSVKYQCFKEGTLVKTKDGLKAIEEIKEGDLVLSYDEKTGKSAYKRVLSLSRNVTKKWCEVSLIINGKKETITSTPGHKYYLPDNDSNRDANEVLEHASYIGLSSKWVSAKDLKCGDKVLLSNGSYGIIDSVVIDDLDHEEITYNFEVEDYHTYFVGDSEVCVHNAGCGDVGVYELEFDDGTSYVGKGTEKRMNQSIKRLSKGRECINNTFTTCADNKSAFIMEHAKMIERGWGTPGNSLLNKINSPGMKLSFEIL